MRWERKSIGKSEGRTRKEMEKDETRLQETQTTGKKAVREKLRMK